MGDDVFGILLDLFNFKAEFGTVGYYNGGRQCKVNYWWWNCYCSGDIGRKARFKVCKERNPGGQAKKQNYKSENGANSLSLSFF